jgi:hydrogenase maturation factor
MTLSAFLEEGLEIALLRRVIDALAVAALDCQIAVVAGDTKVVGRGDCDGLYLATTGIGFRPSGALIWPRENQLVFTEAVSSAPGAERHSSGPIRSMSQIGDSHPGAS